MVGDSTPHPFPFKPRPEQVNAVLTALRTGGPYTIDEVAERTRENRTAVAAILQGMVQASTAFSGLQAHGSRMALKFSLQPLPPSPMVTTPAKAQSPTKAHPAGKQPQPAPKPKPTSQPTPPASSPAGPPVAALLAQLGKQVGEAGLKITLTGRPGPITQQAQFVLFQIRAKKLPNFSKGQPTPAGDLTRCAVIVPLKQWARVAQAVEQPDEVLIVEGYPAIEPGYAGIVVYATNVSTKGQQAARFAAQKEQPAQE
jgi:hypothetical protein